MNSFNNTEKKTGLELLQERMQGTSPNPPITKTMGMKIIHVESGFIRFEAIPSRQHLNSLGVVQGGFAASVLDAAAGCAVQSLLPARVKLATVDLNIKFFKPIRLDHEELYAEGRILHMTQRIGAAEGKLVDDHGKPYAHATGTFMIFPLIKENQ